MMRLSILVALGVILGEGKLASAAQNDAAATIRQQYAGWLRAYEQKDLAGMMDIFAPGVVSTFAGARDNDFSAIQHSYEKSFAGAGAPRRWKPVDLEIDVSDNLAYALAD